MRHWKRNLFHIFASSTLTLTPWTSVVAGQVCFADTLMSVDLHSLVNNLGDLENLMTSLNHQNDWFTKVSPWLLMANFEDELVKWFVDDYFFFSHALETWKFSNEFFFFEVFSRRLKYRSRGKTVADHHISSLFFRDEHIIAH